MDGRGIQCLRAKYIDIPDLLNVQCVTELIEVIQTSKIDIKIDIQLYQNCRQYLIQECYGIEQENCLKLNFQKGQIADVRCKEQIQRIIRESQLYLNADYALTSACQFDLLKFCNNIPIGRIIYLKYSLTVYPCVYRKYSTITMFIEYTSISNESMCKHVIKTRRIMEQCKSILIESIQN